MTILNFLPLILMLLSVTSCYEFEETLGHLKPSASSNIQTEAVINLVKRYLPERYTEFEVIVNESFSEDAKDTFKLENIDGTVRITATTGVTAATGFHYYLKYYCNCHISWEILQLQLPKILPEVNETITLNDRLRYYQNVCTTSYSFVWWNWEQWEKHIDWMALNSFNLVLAFNGQEAIWERVYRKLNLTPTDIDEHFTGPAFLSWLRMGNIRGWAGPLSNAWHTRSLILQKQIINRMRSFGIITVLPAFAGHLPRAFKRLYPDVNMTKIDSWNQFNDSYCCPYFLDPTEDLFKTIGQMFIQEQIAEYGTDHIYNCDSFNEVDPSTTDLAYLSNVGKSIFAAMSQADSDAIWLMQGWLFVHSITFWTRERAKALITSVPIGKMIILDLQSEEFPQYSRLDQYYGQPYIWCMLHNFGGTLGMFGSADIINERVIEARNDNGSTMVGTGLTMEGIHQNYVIYDLMTENAWRTEPTDLSEWFKKYTIRRYGSENNDLILAWKYLKRSVYNFNGTERQRGHYAITDTPSIDISTWTWYSYPDLIRAWELFINTADDMKHSPGFLHDLVDVTRQVLQQNGDIYYNILVSTFLSRDNLVFQITANIFREILLDAEAILATNDAFLLGNWIKSAKECANNSEDEIQFEYNARNQITLWGPNGEIMNYANKQWSGIMSDFYYARWNLFIDAMNVSMTENTLFNETKIHEDMFELVEQPFTFDRKIYPTSPQGDTVEIAKRIYDKQVYGATMNYLFRPESSVDQSTLKSSERRNLRKYMRALLYDSDPEIILIY